MKSRIKCLFFFSIRIMEIFLFPITCLSLTWLKVLKNFKWKYGFDKLPLTSSSYRKFGLLPVTRFYYEPFAVFDTNLKRPNLEIELNLSEQKAMLKEFDFADELRKLPLKNARNGRYYYQNASFEYGDAEVLYNMIRRYKPGRIIEIGSGFSTLMTLEALEKNKAEEQGNACRFDCIEPYQFHWLAGQDINLIKRRVEEIELDFFKSLQEDDILFIDSSHIIRPQGDVLYEFLHILPVLERGVLVHVHDIFTPNHYPSTWIRDRFRLWNEQYLLEAFLLLNRHFKVICSLNYLNSLQEELLYRACPLLDQNRNHQPASFWMRKVL